MTQFSNTSFVDLPICKYDSPVKRLREINNILRAGNEKSCVSLIVPWAAYFFGCHVNPISKFMSTNRAISIGNVFMFNVLYFFKKLLRFDMIGKLINLIIFNRGNQRSI